MKSAAVVAILVGACGGSPAPVPTGEHFHYVVNQLRAPTNNDEARRFGLDLNNDKTVDNQLGMVIGTLRGQGFDIQTSIDHAVSTGDILLLVDVQSDDFTESRASGARILLGESPAPSPCSGPGDQVCRNHLDGNGSFAVSPASLELEQLTGSITGGTFTAGPGKTTIQLALGGPQTVLVPLIGARVNLAAISDTNIATGVIAGGVTVDDLDTILIPAFHAAVTLAIERDCSSATAPPCGCIAGSPGDAMLQLFDDQGPADCRVDIDEILNDNATQSILAPDVTLGGVDMLSFGVGITAVRGTFSAE